MHIVCRHQFKTNGLFIQVIISFPFLKLMIFKAKTDKLQKAVEMQDKRLEAQEAEIESLKSVPGK